MYREKFIKRIALVAREGQEKYNILASLTMAQAILESNWGRNPIGNNIFGIKKGSSWKGKTRKVFTHEHIGGKKIKIIDEFRVYDSIEDSIRDYHRLLSSATRYRHVLKAKNYREAALRVREAGYATDPRYSAKLIAIIEEYGLDSYDKFDGPSFWARESWKWAKSLGISDGTRPKSSATREEVVTMLYRLKNRI